LPTAVAFAYPSQRLQDWLSQQWVIALGRRIEPAAVPWLAAPYGMVDTIGDTYLERLALGEGLTIERMAKRRRDDDTAGDTGLFSLDQLGLDPAAAARLHPEIAEFYGCTTAFDLEMWVLWSPWFWAGGNLLRRLYSRRLQQLNLPMNARETSRGLRSEIIRLRTTAGEVRHTIWYRVLKSTGEALYSGLYGIVDLPGGERCLKIVFPLPRGNATEIFRIAVGPEGDFLLDTDGRRFGDPGFYFQLVDGRGQHHAQHIPSFRDRLRVYVDEDGVLRADQVFTLWGRTVVELRYRMLRRSR